MANTLSAAETVYTWQRVWPKIATQQSKIGTKYLEVNLGTTDYAAAKALNDNGNTGGLTAVQLGTLIHGWMDKLYNSNPQSAKCTSLS